MVVTFTSRVPIFYYCYKTRVQLFYFLSEYFNVRYAVTFRRFRSDPVVRLLYKLEWSPLKAEIEIHAD